MTCETLTTPVRSSSSIIQGLLTELRYADEKNSTMRRIITDEHKHRVYFYNIMNRPKISTPAPTVDADAVDVCQLCSSANGDVHYKSPLKSLIRSDLTDSVVVTWLFIVYDLRRSLLHVCTAPQYQLYSSCTHDKKL